MTEDELGLDVVVSLQIYGARRDDARARVVADLRRATLRASELERYGELLDVDKHVFLSGSLEDALPDPTPPNPADELTDDRASSCLEEVLACELGTACEDFLELEGRGGYVLTHQAVALLFALWVDCPLAIDVEARRLAIAGRLLAEMRADAVASDLAYERLAMIAHLGFAAEIEPGWWELVVRAQTLEGCFPLGPGEPCHPHPTGVAIWALAHAP